MPSGMTRMFESTWSRGLRSSGWDFRDQAGGWFEIPIPEHLRCPEANPASPVHSMLFSEALP